MSERNFYPVRESEQTLEFRRQLREAAQKIARRIYDERRDLASSASGRLPDSRESDFVAPRSLPKDC